MLDAPLCWLIITDAFLALIRKWASWGGHSLIVSRCRCCISSLLLVAKLLLDQIWRCLVQVGQLSIDLQVVLAYYEITALLLIMESRHIVTPDLWRVFNYLVLCLWLDPSRWCLHIVFDVIEHIRTWWILNRQSKSAIFEYIPIGVRPLHHGLRVLTRWGIGHVEVIWVKCLWRVYRLVIIHQRVNVAWVLSAYAIKR